MSTEIYYFSGTGNSLYVAQEIQKKIPDTKLIPIVSLLHQEVIQTKGKRVGIIFPVYALTIPIPVKWFLKKLDISSAEYVFAVATRLGIVFKEFKRIDKILKKKNSGLNSHFVLNMYSNDVKVEDYRSPKEAEISKLEIIVQNKLDKIINIILNQITCKEKDFDFLIGLPYNPILNYFLEKFIVSCMTVSEYIGGVKYFCTDSKCTGCGVCEKVCLSGKIKMCDNKPMWQKKVLCYMCYACINYCPVNSIQINSIPGVKSFTRQNGRYTHPYASIQDIAKQKVSK